MSVHENSGLDRNRLVQYIESKNIQTRLLFSGNIVRQPCFDTVRGTSFYRVVGNLSNTDFVMNNTFWVGTYPGMTDGMLEYMSKSIIEAVSAL